MAGKVSTRTCGRQSGGRAIVGPRIGHKRDKWAGAPEEVQDAAVSAVPFMVMSSVAVSQ